VAGRSTIKRNGASLLSFRLLIDRTTTNRGRFSMERECDPARQPKACLNPNPDPRMCLIKQ
jgi:hypothetical protein